MAGATHHALKAWTLGFAGGVVVGLLIGWWALAEDDGVREPLAPACEAAPPTLDHEPRLEVRERTKRAEPTPTPGTAGAASNTQNEKTEAPTERVNTYVQVVLDSADEKLARHGTAYAVPAGEHSGRGDDLPTANAEAGLRIPLVDPGTYDIGYVVYERRVLERNVAVEAGGTTTVHLTVPQRVHVELAWPEGLPPPDQWVNLQVRMTGPGRSPRPGRHERLLWAWSAQWDPNSANPIRYVPVPADERVTASGKLVVKRGPSWTTSPSHLLRTAPGTVGPGGTVSLMPRSIAVLRLRAAPTPAPPRGIRLHMKIRFEQGAHNQTVDRYLSLPGTDRDKPMPAVDIWGCEGLARVSWTGPGLRPGTLDDLELTSEGPVEVALPLVPETSWADARRALESAGRRRPDPSRMFRFEGLREGGPDDESPVLVQVRESGKLAYDPVDRTEAARPAGAGDVQTAVAYDGPWLASEPIDVPARGTTPMRLVSAGLLTLVPEHLPPENAGGLHLQRVDGVPIPFYWLDAGDQPAGNPTEASIRIEVWPGRTIGPFPAGAVRFEVFVGRARRGEIVATVRAGRITPLVVTW